LVEIVAATELCHCDLPHEIQLVRFTSINLKIAEENVPEESVHT